MPEKIRVMETKWMQYLSTAYLVNQPQHVPIAVYIHYTS